MLQADSDNVNRRYSRHFFEPAIRSISVLGILLVVCAFRFLLRNESRIDVSLLLPLAGVAGVSILAGLTQGVVTTIFFAAVEWRFYHGSAIPFPPHIKWLLESGLLMGVVSGQVHDARRRARASGAATLDLERKVLEIGDEERRRIGHDLHDGLGQHLTGISLLSTSLANRIQRTAPDASADAEKISQLVAQSVGWTRDLARGLSPVTLESAGLYAALEELANNARSLMGIHCLLECEGDEPRIEMQRSLHVFRIVQEAVNNSVKHGKARTVRVHLTVDRKMLTVTISDDGCGLSAKTKANPGLGLRIMNYRARMVGATLGIDRILLAPDRVTPASGTIITVRCPLTAVAP